MQKWKEQHPRVFAIGGALMFFAGGLATIQGIWNLFNNEPLFPYIATNIPFWPRILLLILFCIIAIFGIVLVIKIFRQTTTHTKDTKAKIVALAEIKTTQLTNKKELFTAIHQLKETAREVISTSNALRYIHEIAKGDPPQSLVTDFAKAVDKHEEARKALECQELIAGKAFHNPINEFFTKIQSCIQNPGPLQKQPNSNVVCVNSGEVFNKLNDALNEAIKEIDMIS